MRAQRYLFRLKMKKKFIEGWYSFWKGIGKLTHKPYNYFYDKRVAKWSNPDNYDREKLLDIIELQMVKELFTFHELNLLHANHFYESEWNNLDVAYTYINNSKNRYITKYRRYALRNDKSFDWVQHIIDNTPLRYEVKTGKDFIERYSPVYNQYKDTNVYVFKLK